VVSTNSGGVSCLSDGAQKKVNRHTSLSSFFDDGYTIDGPIGMSVFLIRISAGLREENAQASVMVMAGIYAAIF
jgi:hypothetical protein